MLLEEFNKMLVCMYHFVVFSTCFHIHVPLSHVHTPLFHVTSVHYVHMPVCGGDKPLCPVCRQLLTMVLDHYVFVWYREISIHDQLVDEIRYIIRYAVAALATKLSKVW